MRDPELGNDQERDTSNRAVAQRAVFYGLNVLQKFPLAEAEPP